MGRFYLRLWIEWVGRITVESFLGAAVVTSLIVLYFYIEKGMPGFETQILHALWKLFAFWFWIVWSVVLLVALFRSVKYLFGKCRGGYALKLLACNTKETIEPIGYGDIVKVWRRWFMLLIWIVAVFVLFGSIVGRFVFDVKSVFEWLGLEWLYVFVVAGGYFAIVLTVSLCKRVRVERC